MDIEYDYESLPTENFSVHLVAGAAAGILEHCLMYPVDCVKTRLQCLRPSSMATYTGVVDGLWKMVRTEGVWSPLRGVTAVLVGAGPAHALYFSSYEMSKKVTMAFSSFDEHSPVNHGVAGLVATLAHDSFMNPVEVVKQRLQMYNSPYVGVLDCTTRTYHEEGLRAFYRSFTTQLSMNIPYHMVNIVGYEYFRKQLNPDGSYNPKAHIIAGGLAGAFASAITNPLDVAKTLLNTQEKCAICQTVSPSMEKPPPMKGLVNAMKTVYQLRGARGFLQGIQARVVYQMPSCAICWSVYEFFKHFLILRNDTVSN